MTWYNPTTWRFKLNPAQQQISEAEGSTVTTTATISYSRAFSQLESVNRGVNLIVSACAGLDYDIKDKKLTGTVIGTKQKALDLLLNLAPNPYQSTQEFRNLIFIDFILEGNIFIYYDGVHMYHLPAAMVSVEPDPKTFVSGYVYDGHTRFKSTEIIHIKDLSGTSIYRGTSRLESADRSIKILYKMQQFQEQFFENGAVPGIILTTENTLSEAAKDRNVARWTQRYNPLGGARRPMIIDSGLKPVQGLSETFKEMDFDTSIKTHGVKILQSLGVPPILLDGGNNANISPNLRLFYLETVLPIVRKFGSAIERYFGYDIEPITANVSALQPEMKDLASYYTTLVNGGILSPNEARIELRYEKISGHDDLRIPANIAGSAADPSTGGAPKKPEPKQ